MIDRNDAANAAIRNAIEELRPNVAGSWMTLEPHEPPLSFDHPAACMGFIGLIVELYNDAVAPAQTADAAHFADLCGEQLIVLRDAIVEATQP